MAKAKEFWYVLVMTQTGPKFVTKVEGSTAHWNEEKAPLHMTKSMAKEMATGLTMNGNTAFAVCMDYEKETQPYNYEDYEFSFVRREGK